MIFTLIFISVLSRRLFLFAFRWQLRVFPLSLNQDQKEVILLVGEVITAAADITAVADITAGAEIITAVTEVITAAAEVITAAAALEVMVVEVMAVGVTAATTEAINIENFVHRSYFFNLEKYLVKNCHFQLLK